MKSTIMEHSTIQFAIILLTGLVTISSCLSTEFDCDTSGNCSGSPWKLAFLQETSVHVLSVSENSSVTKIPQDNEHRPAGLTTSVRENEIFWTDQDVNGEPVIYGFSHGLVSHKNSPQIIVDSGIYEPQGLAIDWITNNLYFVDSKAKRIIVCPIISLRYITRTTRCAVVFKEESGTPYAIALNPNRGLMFWTNEKYPAIKKAGLDGAAPLSLVSTDIQVPKAIAVDDDTVFWSDLRKETIETVKFDGTNRKILIKEVYTLGIGILDESILWASPHENELPLQKADKHTGQNQTEVLSLFLRREIRIGNITDISVMHLSTQPITRNNSCEDKNCSDICVLSGSDDAICICPEGMLKINNTCSVESVPKIFVAQNRILLQTEDGAIGTKVFQPISLPSRVWSIDAIVYNPRKDSIILYDGIRKQIWNFNPKTNELDLLVEKDLINVTSMDIDFLTQNLFWYDAGKNRIEMYSLKSGSRLVVYKNFHLGHQVVNNFGTLYVTKTGISGRQEMHSVTLESPVRDELIKTFSPDDLPLVQMTYDQATHILVTASSNDTHLTIQSEHTADKESTIFILNQENPVDGLKKIGNRVFWVDRTNKMKALTPVESLDGRYLLDRIPITISLMSWHKDYTNSDRMDNNFKKLIAVSPGLQYVQEFENRFYDHYCNLESVLCPHFCLPTQNLETEFVCMCETGHKVAKRWFGDDYTTCVKVNYSEIDAFGLNPNLESPDLIRNASNEVTGKEKSGAWFWVTIILSLIFLLLCGLVGFVFWYLNKRRSTPVLVVPYTRNVN